MKAFRWLLFLLQVGVTFGVLLALYLLFALLDYRGGFPGLVGLLLVQPLLGGALTAGTIVVCLAIGLPLRLLTAGQQWWQRHWYLAWLGGGLALGLLLLSLLLMLLSSSSVEVFVASHPGIIAVTLSAWFLLAFSLLHLALPRRLHTYLLSSAENLSFRKG